ncbi:TIGR03943 family protein [Hydrococcus rivularis NIES-593]|uniref:TIGR03943 family protein n=1 Tax=Hydrococcus rivularis NIES-593 TaxID=1921803 RepID=A0A1U7H7G8_9CYAN|nr:TIGR03943 family protein [Hydrococcus rivularis]OKH18371.1 TIGR03943 family protein [Hydrococcus rivularis NIES-593]
MSQQSTIQNPKSKSLLPWLDVLALLAWGGLLLRYWITGQLRLLIHPNYFWLVLVTGIALLILGALKGGQLLADWRKRGNNFQEKETVQHMTLLPPGVGSGVLVATALAGFLIAPTVLTSQAALQRGVTESLPITRSQPQSFRATTRPEERSIVDWIRTLNAYPEPDAYAGQPVKVTGFVVHLPHLSDNYLLISRFIITCCAVDAYPVGLPVKLESSRNNYPPDTWLEIEGEMMVETLPQHEQTMKETTAQKRQLVIAAKSLKKIPTPADPYSY